MIGNWTFRKIKVNDRVDAYAWSRSSIPKEFWGSKGINIFEFELNLIYTYSVISKEF